MYLFSPNIPLQYETSQDIVHLSSQCQLRCFGCDIWKKELPKPGLQKLKPAKKIVNLIGGEPTLQLDNIAALKQKFIPSQVKIRLWTNGLISLDIQEELNTFVDEYFLYLPTTSSQTYKTITGSHEFHKVLQFIESCQERNKPLIFNTPVTQENITELPDIHDFAYLKDCSCLFHFSPESFIEKEAQGYINRFKRVPRRFTIKRREPIPQSWCQGLPLKDTTQLPGLIRLGIQNLMDRMPPFFRV